MFRTTRPLQRVLLIVTAVGLQSYTVTSNLMSTPSEQEVWSISDAAHLSSILIYWLFLLDHAVIHCHLDHNYPIRWGLTSQIGHMTLVGHVVSTVVFI